MIASSTPPDSPTPPPRSRAIDLTLVALLVIFAIALRGWQLRHTEVASRDSVGFIRIAWRLEQAGDSWASVLRESEQHPGYPLAVLAARRLLGPGDGDPESVRWQLAAQLVTAVASVLLVLPMYALGRLLFRPGVAFGATLLFQCLPSSGGILADGLSEGLFLLLTATSWYLTARAFVRSSPFAFALAGLTAGAAYWVRPEGALTVVATGAALLWLVCRVPEWTWRRGSACGLGLAAGAAVAVAAFVGVTGKLTTKPTANRIVEPAPANPQSFLPGEARLAPTGGGPGPLFAVWWDGQTHPLWWPIQGLVIEIVKGSFFLLWVPCLLGLWWDWGRWSRQPGAWVPLLVCLAVYLLLLRVARVMGYVSERHLMLPLLFGLYHSVNGLFGLVTRLGERIRLLSWWRHPVASGLVLAAVAGLALSRTLLPLHADRSGFRAAGLWLAERVRPGDEVADPYLWASFYAGDVFRRAGPASSAEPNHAAFRYVVLEKSNNAHKRLPGLDEAKAWSARGEEVFRVPVRRRKDRGAAVVVYRLPRNG